MPKRKIVGVGMMQRAVVVASTPAEMEQAIEAWSQSFPKAEPGDWFGDAVRRENARRCKAILATIGMQDDGTCGFDISPLRAAGLNEDSAQWIAAEWLAAYNGMRQARERFDRDGSTAAVDEIARFAEEMGCQQERMWWRSGVDPETGERREALALRDRTASKSRKKGGETNRGEAEKWRGPACRLAASIMAESPGIKVSECARRVIKRWDVSGIDPPKFDSLRKILGKV